MSPSTPSLLERAREDTPEGYAAFYELVYGKPLPDYTRAWMEYLYSTGPCLVCGGPKAAHYTDEKVRLNCYKRMADAG